MGLFSNYNEVEKQLLEHYTQFFTAMGLPDANHFGVKHFGVKHFGVNSVF